MSGGGVSVPSVGTATANTPQIQPLKTPLVGVPQPPLMSPMNNQAQQGASGLYPNTFQYPFMQSAAGWTSFDPSHNTFNFNTPFSDAVANQLNDTFQQGSQAFGALGQTVQPGFSLFRQAGLSAIENQRQQTQSNLQGNLAQRRVLGSSFANQSISGANADFAEKSANFIAQSYLQELQASMQTTQAQYDMSTKGYAAKLANMNFDATLGAQMSAQMGSVMASVAQTQGALDLSAAQTNAQAAVSQAQLTVQEQNMMLQASEFNAQMQMAEMMGIGQLAGGLLGGAMGGGGKSDIRVKRDIEQIGKWLNGLPVYVFRYIDEPGFHIGFMAQDVEQVMPEAVYEVDGIKHVNYAMAVR